MKIKKYISVALVLTPFLVLAAQINDIAELIDLIITILNYTIPLLIAVAVVIFLWGVVQYITAAGAEDKRKEGQQKIMWGIIGLFVMLSVWGFVWILLNTFALDRSAPDFPQLFEG